jgi:hypothetical protein
MTSVQPKSVNRVEDWQELKVGDRVLAGQAWPPETIGTVDAVTPDGAVLWLQQDAGRGRRLFCKVDGIRLWQTAANYS